MSKLRCPFLKQKQNKNATKSQQNHNKNIVKYKTKQIKTHKDTANQIQAFAFFLFLF